MPRTSRWKPLTTAEPLYRHRVLSCNHVFAIFILQCIHQTLIVTAVPVWSFVACVSSRILLLGVCLTLSLNAFLVSLLNLLPVGYFNVLVPLMLLTCVFSPSLHMAALLCWLCCYLFLASVFIVRPFKVFTLSCCVFRS